MLGERPHSGVLDISEKMLHSNFLCFFCSYLTLDMVKCLSCGGTIVVYLRENTSFAIKKHEFRTNLIETLGN